MKALEGQLSKLRQRVTEMGDLTQQMVAGTVDLLSHPHDKERIQEIFRQEDQLDHMQLDIDRMAMQLMVLYSPVAADLRLVMSVSRLTVELERIGDQAVNLCKSAELLPTSGDICLLPQIHQLARIVREMVGDSLDAFNEGDSEKARATIDRDDEADRLNHQIVEELLNDPTEGDLAQERSHLADSLAQVLIARSLERMGDQSTNICEEVVYAVQGQDIRHHHDGQEPPLNSNDEGSASADRE